MLLSAFVCCVCVHTEAAVRPGPLWATMAPEMALIQLCISSGLSACGGQMTRVSRLQASKQTTWIGMPFMQWCCSKTAHLNVESSGGCDDFKQIVSHHYVTANTGNKIHVM